jgi:putative redox protein
MRDIGEFQFSVPQRSSPNVVECEAEFGAAMIEYGERLEFQTANGQHLETRLYPAPGPDEPRELAIFTHSLPRDRSPAAVDRILRGLSELGVRVLELDLTSSECSVDPETLDASVLVAAADALQKEGAAPGILVGHGIAGTEVMLASSRIPSVRAVATIGCTAPPHLGSGVFKGGSSANRAALDVPAPALLILHSPDDEIVDFANASRIFSSARGSRSLVSLDASDHRLTRPESANYAATILCDWIDHLIPPAPDPGFGETSPNDAVVTEWGEGVFTQHVVMGPHRIHCDEPLEYDGDDTGPHPYHLLLASLGTCTSMTLRAAARREAIPLKSLSVRLSHGRISTQDGSIDLIQRRIKIGGDLDSAHRQRLLAVANRCPAHVTFETGVQIETRLER